MSSPDLFVVCKNCQAEVSPYITECPYCGTRLRKRAPKIERPGSPGEAPKPVKPDRYARKATKPIKAPKPERAPRERAPRLARLRTGEIPGVRGDELGRPYATFLLIFLITGVWLATAFTVRSDLALVALDDDPWRYVTATAFNVGFAAQLAAIVGVGLFGWLLERRHGPLVVLLVFAVCGPGALAGAVELDDTVLVFGSHGAALGLLAAWLVPVLLGRRKHGADSDDADLMGAGIMAIVFFVMPVASYGSVLAGVLGGAAGLVIGLLLHLAKPR